MKRILALVLSLMLLCVGFAEVAEKVAEEIAEPFEFEIRGMKWGMNRDEVVSVMGEPDEGDEEENPDDGSMFRHYNQVPVSNYTADVMTCGFVNDQLHVVLYRWEEGLEQAGIDYLTAALCSKYGETIPSDVARLSQALSLPSEAGEVESEVYGSWALKDGTYIAAFDMYGGFYIYYCNEAELLEIRGIYNTNGL